MKFNELDLPLELLESIEKMGFEEATPIQEQVLPVAREGHDVIGQAQTGTGKTTAFGLPMLEKIDMDNPNVQALVLAPTRELAVQVADELTRLGRNKKVKTVAVYGGADISRQIRELKSRPQIVVATPGRYMDHTRRRTIRPASIETVVLDEADEMLSMGFVEDIEAILEEVPDERQTLLFSATMPTRLKKVSDRFMKDPKTVSVKAKTLTVDNIEQFAVKVPEKHKLLALTRIIELEDPELAIIFGRTKRRVDELSEALEHQGYAAAGIHGDLKQAQRTNVLRRFKQGSVKFLVATDVAARGIDVSGVSHVFNFDIPQESESYVHRIGRTGRAGQSGKAYTFAAPIEMDHLSMIERETKGKIKTIDLPSKEEASDVRQSRLADELVKVIQSNGQANFEATAEKLLQSYDAKDVVAAALASIQNDTKEPMKTLTGERPVVNKKRSKAPSSNKNKKGGRRFYEDRDGRNRNRRRSSGGGGGGSRGPQSSGGRRQDRRRQPR
ncbi:DEAD/DEAH box helicase [Geomicrobium sp. JCM 19038]|uniref:DEAD/DEAH box helicase n=1 Tax=Geomicrobium sp. JCM 19038 TaxID=1460635 RepID=UPI00045F18CB|nr:DEAD/DEAH box helicase [Geomicrobium sp. JCM 19038]GAK09242.1 cold-shock DEAD-box protein A [Geomicrobium sp. JCM 19038]